MSVLCHSDLLTALLLANPHPPLLGVWPTFSRRRFRPLRQPCGLRGKGSFLGALSVQKSGWLVATLYSTRLTVTNILRTPPTPPTSTPISVTLNLSICDGGILLIASPNASSNESLPEYPVTSSLGTNLPYRAGNPIRGADLEYIGPVDAVILLAFVVLQDKALNTLRDAAGWQRKRAASLTRRCTGGLTNPGRTHGQKITIRKPEPPAGFHTPPRNLRPIASEPARGRTRSGPPQYTDQLLAWSQRIRERPRSAAHPRHAAAT